ncbi:MAG: DUF421 domain-containing protein [Acidobacteriota bacterium]
MFFSDWGSLGRVALVGVLAYAALVLLLRISGKRTLSKMNAFDLVVTVAIGSTLATVLLSKSTTLADGIVAFGLLISMQFAVTWSSVRSTWVRQIVKAEPSLLFFRGEFLKKAMQAERVTDSELIAAARSQGFGTMNELEAIVLETDGTFSVISKSGGGPGDTLANVKKITG